MKESFKIQKENVLVKNIFYKSFNFMIECNNQQKLLKVLIKNN